MAAIDDVQAYLIEQGVIGGSTDWPTTLRRSHDGTPRLVVLRGDAGPQPELPAETGIGDSAIGDPGVHVTVRGAPDEAPEAEAKAREIIDHLHGLFAVEMGSTEYMRVTALTPEPVDVGVDDRARPIFTVAFRLARLVTSPTLLA